MEESPFARPNGKMFLSDVTRDSKLSFSRNLGSKAISLHALKSCGCDGPWIGVIRLVPRDMWNDSMVEAREAAGFSAAVWELYPVKKDNPYEVFKKPIGWAYGRNNAARMLRDYIVEREWGA